MDRDRSSILRLAQDALNKRADGGYEIHFVFCCPRCGTPCTLVEPNALFEEGECHACGAVTPIEVADFVLVPCGEIQAHGALADEPLQPRSDAATESGTVATDEPLLNRVLIGHTDVRTTLNTYTHVADSVRQDAVAKLGALFQTA